MKIGIVVHGRFHAFHLARELSRLGHEVIVLTNYPKFVCRWFGLEPGQVQSLLLHGIASRLVNRLTPLGGHNSIDRLLHESFGRWAAGHLRNENVDVAHVFSGVAEETLRDSGSHRIGAVVRGSAHIRTQRRLLDDEEARTGARLDKPTDWMVDREMREYEKAGLIIVLSSFAARSFVGEGVPEAKLRRVSLGVDVSHFRASPELLSKRAARIRGGKPLRIVFVGTVSFRKGLADLSEVVRMLAGRTFEFRLVGAITPDAKRISRSLARFAEFAGKFPEKDLPDQYAWGDVFLFPTIEDGFAAVLLQAAANGLPILATENCGAPDFVEEGKSGWIVPIRRPDLLMERLVWCQDNREELAGMVAENPSRFQPPDWGDMARNLAGVFQQALDGQNASRLDG